MWDRHAGSRICAQSPIIVAAGTFNTASTTLTVLTEKPTIAVVLETYVLRQQLCIGAQTRIRRQDVSTEHNNNSAGYCGLHMVSESALPPKVMHQPVSSCEVNTPAGRQGLP